MRVLLLVLFAACGLRGEIRDVIKSAELDAMLARANPDRALHERPNYAVWLKVHDGKPGPQETHPDSDDILHIRKGSAKVALGDRRYDVGAGDIVHIPRNTPHRIDPGRGRLEYVVVRIFPAGDSLPARPGIRPPARRMADVLTKAEIDATIAKSDSNQPIHSSPGYTMNYVIYSGRSGPWEAHRGCVDIYFMQQGTGKAELGGEILNPKEESPGEPRGDGVKGARTYDVGPGDMVLIPRNGVHHMQPVSPKLAYVLMKVWAD